MVSYFASDKQSEMKEKIREHIIQLLPENYTENDVAILLEKLGHPKKMADQYQKRKRYLIGPKLYESYISMLQLVITIIVSLVVVVSVITWIFDFQNHSNIITALVSLTTDAVTSGIEGAIQAAFWVTVVYFILERTDVSTDQIPFTNKKWEINDLLQYSKTDKNSISIVEAGFSIIFSILFTFIICFKPNIIGWYESQNGSLKLIAPFFNEETIKGFIPALLLLLIFYVSINMLKILRRKWDFILASLNLIYNFLYCILVYIIITTENLVTDQFKLQILDSRLIVIFFVVFVIICIIDSISAFIKSAKNNKTERFY